MKKILAGCLMALLLVVVFATGCRGGPSGGGTPDTTAPTVSYTMPEDTATVVPINRKITATFDEAMDPATITTETYLVTGPGTTPVLGTVTLGAGGTTAIFTHSNLDASVLFTATITTGAKDLAGNALESNHVWTFTTGTATEPDLVPVDLGTAGNYVILAKTAISTVPTSAVTGDLGISPAAASFITGFALTMDASNIFSTSSQVAGRIYAPGYAAPTPTNLTTAVSDMEAAYTAAASPAPYVTELGAGNIGGLTLVPGVYKWGTNVIIPTDVMLTGSSTDIWIFQIAGGLTMASAKKVLLSGGALPKNIFWQVANVVAIGTTAHFEGVILAQTAITLGTGATINGRLLAQSAVTLDSSTVTKPAP